MRTQTLDALVLRTYDVGEADRFCVLFTKERGRMAARAVGVRKLTSRKGGALLPFQRALVEVKEGGGGAFILSAQGHAAVREGADDERSAKNLPFFAQAEEGIELLLALTEDAEPLPDVFASTAAFLERCGSNASLLLAYQLRLLHLLGFLPEGNAQSFMHLSPEEHAFLAHARHGTFDDLPRITSHPTLRAVAEALLEDQITQPLKAGSVASTLMQ